MRLVRVEYAWIYQQSTEEVRGGLHPRNVQWLHWSGVPCEGQSVCTATTGPSLNTQTTGTTTTS
jgi:hypothetical protein